MAKKKGRPQTRAEPNARVVAGQIEPDERRRLEALTARTGRNLSYVVRMAIVRLLADDVVGAIDWSVAPELQKVTAGEGSGI